MVNPNLNAYFTISRICFCESIINVCAQSLKRDCPFAVELGTGNICPAKAPGNGGLDTFRANLHCPGHCGLHCPPEVKYALKYNAFHNLESIGVDGKADKLVKYDYKNGNGEPDEGVRGRACYMRGDALEQLGDYKAALAQFAEAMKYYPNPAVIENRITYLNTIIKNNKENK